MVDQKSKKLLQKVRGFFNKFALPPKPESHWGYNEVSSTVPAPTSGPFLPPPRLTDCGPR